jgi:hypothetical protein
MDVSEKLAQALEQANLPALAKKAREDYYHDFKSPLALPATVLAMDLELAGTPAALAVRARHMNGEFDA